jgi:hypothetical protein
MMSRLARPRRTCSESITIFTVSHARGRRSAPTTDPLLHNVQVSPNTLIEMSGSVLSAWTSTIRPIQRFRRRVPRRNQPVSTRTASAGIPDPHRIRNAIVGVPPHVQYRLRSDQKPQGRMAQAAMQRDGRARYNIHLGKASIQIPGLQHSVCLVCTQKNI